MNLVPSVAAADDAVVTPSGSYVHESDVTGLGGSLATADYECVHGRLAGDCCPSPAPGPGDRWVQNWPHPHPCGCWPTEK
jgi:hypothetical protein